MVSHYIHLSDRRERQTWARRLIVQGSQGASRPCS
jgi:hypothetical protein